MYKYYDFWYWFVCIWVGLYVLEWLGGENNEIVVNVWFLGVFWKYIVNICISKLMVDSLN